MEKIKVSVLGCCVSRDAVNCDDFEVLRSVGFISPYTINSGTPVDIDIEKLKNDGLPNYMARNIVLDGGNKALEYLSEERSDWLLFDIFDARSDVFFFNKAGAVLTAGYEASVHQKILVQDLGPCDRISRFDLPEEEFLQRVENECSEILKLYKPEQIIFIESYAVDEFVSLYCQLKKFDEETIKKNQLRNKMFQSVFKVCEEKLTGCHIIRPLQFLFADQEHIWGSHTLHYFAPYYEYLRKAIKIITSSLERKEENVQLGKLQKEYSDIFRHFRELIKGGSRSEILKIRNMYAENYPVRKREVNIISLSILGSDVSMDSLERQIDKYSVDKYIGNLSPFTLLTGASVNIDEESIIGVGIPRFSAYSIGLDGNKSLFDYLNEKRSDWLLLDIFSVISNVLFWPNKGLVLSERPTSVENDMLRKMYGDYNMLAPWDIAEDEQVRRMSELCALILKLYKPEQIIFNEVYCVTDYAKRLSDGRSIIKKFEGAEEILKRQNQLLARMSTLCKTMLKGCRVITMPSNNFADDQNKKGLSPELYTGLYYDYVEKCISVIAEKNEYSLEMVKLKSLYELYNEKMYSYRLWATKNWYMNQKCNLEDTLIRTRKEYNELQNKYNVLEQTNKNLNNSLDVTNSINYNLGLKIKSLEQQETYFHEKGLSLNRLLSKSCKESSILNEELKKIKSSFSYKLGRCITYIPRLISNFFKNK